jgi:hypothetical protein
VWFIIEVHCLHEVRQSSIPTTVTGTPTITAWQQIAARTTRQQEVRAALVGSDPQAAARLLAVMAGGYGVGYNDSLAVFCATARWLSTARGVSFTSTVWRFVFSPHPGYDPSVEHSWCVGLFAPPTSSGISSPH